MKATRDKAGIRGRRAVFLLRGRVMKAAAVALAAGMAVLPAYGAEGCHGLGL